MLSSSDAAASQEIRRVLKPDETLLWTGRPRLWTGRPRQGLVLRPADAFLIPFSLLWGGFAIYWEASVLMIDAPVIFPLFGAVFVLIGLHLIIGRFLVDARARAGTVYGVTDRRSIVVSGMFSRSINSMPLRTLTNLSVRERADGTGTVSLGQPDLFQWWYAGLSVPGLSQHVTPSFELIPEAKKVHDLILEAQRKAA